MRYPKLNQGIAGWRASICEGVHSKIAKIQESTMMIVQVSVLFWF